MEALGMLEGQPQRSPSRNRRRTRRKTAGWPPAVPAALLVLGSVAMLPTPGESKTPLNKITVVEVLWNYGAPYQSTYIGEGEAVLWRWFDKGSYSIEGDGEAATMFTGKGGGVNTVSQYNFTYNYTFLKAGTYYYHCHNHKTIMQGEVHVKPKLNFGGTLLYWFLGISFGGASAIIRAGDTVTWLWSDNLLHALTALDDDYSMFGNYLGTNNSTVTGEGIFMFNKTFTSPGIYIYKCYKHGMEMQGNITVLPKGTAKAPPLPPAGPGKKSPPPKAGPKPRKSPPPKRKRKSPPPKPQKKAPPARPPPPAKKSPPPKKKNQPKKPPPPAPRPPPSPPPQRPPPPKKKSASKNAPSQPSTSLFPKIALSSTHVDLKGRHSSRTRAHGMRRIRKRRWITT